MTIVRSMMKITTSTAAAARWKEAAARAPRLWRVVFAHRLPELWEIAENGIESRSESSVENQEGKQR